MRSRSVAVVGFTAAITLVLLFPSPPLARAGGRARAPSLAAGPAPWDTGPPAAGSLPWYVPVGVAALTLLGLAAVTASAVHHRRVRRQLRWAAREADVAAGDSAHVVTEGPEGLVPGFEVDLEVIPDAPPPEREWISRVTDLAVPTGVRALACPGLDAEALVEEMCGRLPEPGMAAVKLGDRISLARPTWRLIDRRILLAATGLLDLDVTEPLVACLARMEQIRDAGQKTLVDADQPEVIETFVPSGPLTVSHGTTVTVDVQPAGAAAIRFRLDVTATLGETALVVRRGELVEVACQELCLSAALVLVGRSQPLWRCEPLDVTDVHLVPRPPVLVPLLGSEPPPVPRLPEDRRARTLGLPPVPEPPTVPLADRRPGTAPGAPAQAS